MRIDTNNYYIIDTLGKHNLNGDILMGDFLLNEYDEFLSYAKEQLTHPAPKAYTYEIRSKDNKTKAVVFFKIISMLNEYKLASLHLISDDETSLIEGMEALLEYQILTNSMIKITANPSDEKVQFILEQLGFVLNKKDDLNCEYKITKPIYLKGR